MSMSRIKQLLRPKISIKVKLFIIVVFFTVLPWFGYRYLWEIDSYLKLSQQHSLTATSQAVATTLHQRPVLFDQLNQSLSKQSKIDFYNYPLERAVSPAYLQTLLRHHYQKFNHFAAEAITYKAPHVKSNDYSIDTMVASFDNDNYVIFSVTSPTVSTLPANSFRFDKGDHFIIATQDSHHHLKRYLLALNADKTLTLALLPSNTAMIVPQTLLSEYQGFWRKTQKGFDLVLSMPSALLGNKFAFSAYFSQPNDPQQNQLVLASSSTNNFSDLGRLIKPSLAIESIIQSLSYTDARIWVLNSVGQVLASGGDIHNQGNAWKDTTAQIQTDSPFIEKALTPIYQLFSKNTDSNFIDPFNNATEINTKIVKRALRGFTSSEKYLTPDDKAEIIASATPIWDKNEVIGVVIAEQSTQGIEALRNQAMQSLINTVFIVVLLASIAIILFASNISKRIITLRDSARQAVDQRGKFKAFSYHSNSRDEISDLGHCFEDVMQQLGQYNQYLEKMSSRLSHELRTPITVIRSSLEHLELTAANPQQSEKYLKRAQEGLKRLSLILNSMTEASRLESSLKQEHKEVFDLDKVVCGIIEGHKLGFLDTEFVVDVGGAEFAVEGVPEYFAQLLDKLVSNAVDFSTSRHPIKIKVRETTNSINVSVENEGPCLPQGMEKEIFSSLISIRATSSDSSPHLGFGLYIAKLITDFHQGRISANNRIDVQGVSVTVSIPKYRES